MKNKDVRVVDIASLYQFLNCFIKVFIIAYFYSELRVHDLKVVSGVADLVIGKLKLQFQPDHWCV